MSRIRREISKSICLGEAMRTTAKESFSITQPSSVLQYELNRQDVFAVRGDTTINEIACQKVSATLLDSLWHRGASKVTLCLRYYI